MRPNDLKMSGKTKMLVILMIIGFACMEFPGVFFFKDMAEPYIFGFPFIYGWNLICWAYLVIVCAIAYFINWGEPKPSEIEEKMQSENGGGDDK